MKKYYLKLKKDLNKKITPKHKKIHIKKNYPTETFYPKMKKKKKCRIDIKAKRLQL